MNSGREVSAPVSKVIAPLAELLGSKSKHLVGIGLSGKAILMSHAEVLS